MHLYRKWELHMDEGNTFLQEARFLSYLILTTRYDLDEQIRNDILVFGSMKFYLL